MAELGLSSPDSKKLAVVILRDRTSLSVYGVVMSRLLKIEQLWL